MWGILLTYFFTNPKLQNSDQAFIDEWEAAIDMYGKIFSGVTLDVATGSGLPHFDPAPTSCPALNPNCQANCPVLNTDCVAEAEILSYFAEPTVGGPSRKAGETDGMKASGAAILGPRSWRPSRKMATAAHFSLGRGAVCEIV